MHTTNAGGARATLAAELFLLLRAVQHRERLFRRRASGASGVTGSERMVLRIVGRHPQLSSGDLARLLQLNPSTLTGVVDRLVRRRLIARSSDADDRRRSLLALTTSGRRVDRLRGDTVETCFQRALARIAPTHVSSASLVLAALVQELSRGDRARERGSARVLLPFPLRRGGARPLAGRGAPRLRPTSNRGASKPPASTAS